MSSLELQWPFFLNQKTASCVECHTSVLFSWVDKSLAWAQRTSRLYTLGSLFTISITLQVETLTKWSTVQQHETSRISSRIAVSSQMTCPAKMNILACLFHVQQAEMLRLGPLRHQPNACCFLLVTDMILQESTSQEMV